LGKAKPQLSKNPLSYSAAAVALKVQLLPGVLIRILIAFFNQISKRIVLLFPLSISPDAMRGFGVLGFWGFGVLDIQLV